MPLYPYAARCDAFCTKATQRDHVLCSHSALPVTNQMMRIVGWHTAASTRLCLNPTSVFLLNPAATFRQLHERFRRLWINGDAYHRLFLWWFLLLVGVRQRCKIFCALFQYAGGGLLSLYDVAFAVHRADFSAGNPSERRDTASGSASTT